MRESLTFRSVALAGVRLVIGLGAALAAVYFLERSDVTGFARWAIEVLIAGVVIAWASGELHIRSDDVK